MKPLKPIPVNYRLLSVLYGATRALQVFCCILVDDFEPRSLS
jgi:hypothetical protein